ncbi:AMP-dependent synthetase and ligase [Alicyclobacillus acidocaldarius subsp. acidocaldarius Tc-4-1]|uniref:AMP-dependent synthetase and ligase n=2 Tax=Alicyclobacillus acidocaldarius TaxID=405212 RepID=F8ID70_ALIAT|nr:AMP-dependent synthetase and ligase [Alicyclobacillus acidocaldarius subsp. acidocaldarius Tc-4-1]
MKGAIEHEEVVLMDDIWTVDGEDLRKLPYEAMYAKFRWPTPDRLNIAEWACRRHARVCPNAPAIWYDVDGGSAEMWTFGHLWRTTSRLAWALRDLGVPTGGRVAILLPQSPQLAAAHLASYAIGAIAVPLFTLFGTDALRYRLQDSGATVVVTGSEQANQIMDIRADLPDLEHVIVTDARVPGTQFWDDVLALASSAEYHPMDASPDDPAVLIYTSGTTGSAKGALHDHRILLGHLPGVSLPHDFAPQPGDVFWTPADWAWIGGLYDVLLPALCWGVPVVAHRMRKFDPERAFALMERWRVRNAFMPPTSLKMMRHITDPRSRWHLHLRTLATGGEPLGAELLSWAREALGLSIHEFYGQTECNLVVANCSACFPPKPGSMGRPVPGHDVAVIDENGHVVSPGVIGEIAVRRPDPVMFIGYWNRPEETAAKFVGDWLKTGDLGRMDEEGYLWFVGRADDVITSAGYRIGPVEIEEAALQHSAVVMAAAVGTPDPVRGEVVKLFVKLREGVPANECLTAELQNWVKERVGAHSYPREIEFVDELPLTPSGKVRRRALREREYAQKGVPLPGKRG